MTRTRNPNHAIAATVAAVALLAFAGTWSFEEVPPGLPGLGAVEFPRLICLVLLGLAGLLFFQQAAPPDPDAVAPDRAALAIWGCCALFLPAMFLIGLLGAGALFLVAAGRLWGETRWTLLLAVSLGLTLCLWLVFVKGFRLTLPAGLVFGG